MRNQEYRRLTIFIEKALWSSGPVLFKPVLVKSQLSIQIFSSRLALAFSLLNVSFPRLKVLNLNDFFVFCLLVALYQKIFVPPLVVKNFSDVFFQDFYYLTFMFRSMMLFKSTFLCGVGSGPVLTFSVYITSCSSSSFC